MLYCFIVDIEKNVTNLGYSSMTYKNIPRKDIKISINFFFYNNHDTLEKVHIIQLPYNKNFLIWLKCIEKYK